MINKEVVEIVIELAQKFLAKILQSRTFERPHMIWNWIPLRSTVCTHQCKMYAKKLEHIISNIVFIIFSKNGISEVNFLIELGAKRGG